MNPELGIHHEKPKCEGDIKHVQVRLDQTEYEQLVAEMEKRGIDHLQEAVEEAVRSWLGLHGPFKTITEQEERYLQAILKFVREHPQDALMRPSTSWLADGK